MTHADKLKEWGAPPMKPEEEGMNSEPFQRLRYNPDYELAKDVKLGDEVIIGTYASSRDGSPNIRWTQVIVTEYHLKQIENNYAGFIEVRRRKNGTS